MSSGTNVPMPRDFTRVRAVSACRSTVRDCMASDMETIANTIDGKLVAPATGRYLDDYEPATGRVYAQVPESGAEDLDAAVAAAQVATGGP